MKVAVVLASNTCSAPYIYHYIRVLKEKNIDFDIIVWNKDNIEEEDCISYTRFSDLKESRLFRIKNYFEYAKFVRYVLNKNKYDRVIVFTIFLGLLLYPYLQNKFKNYYYFDVRDYSPILRFFPGIIKPVIKNSFCTAISSPGFLKWLPKSKKYVISHNYSFKVESTSIEDILDLDMKHIILTIGFLRDFETNKNIIISFKDNKNIILKFVGRGLAYEPLINFVKENNIQNVEFTGGYEKKHELEYLKKASLINILLGDDLNSKTLMTNRLYLAISNKIPVIVNNNSMQGEYVQKYNLGIVIDNKELINEAVFNYLAQFDREVFLKGSAEFLSTIVSDQKQFESSFNKFLEK